MSYLVEMLIEKDYRKYWHDQNLNTDFVTLWMSRFPNHGSYLTQGWLPRDCTSTLTSHVTSPPLWLPLSSLDKSCHQWSVSVSSSACYTWNKWNVQIQFYDIIKSLITIKKPHSVKKSLSISVLSVYVCIRVCQHTFIECIKWYNKIIT